MHFSVLPKHRECVSFFCVTETETNTTDEIAMNCFDLKYWIYSTSEQFPFTKKPQSIQNPQNKPVTHTPPNIQINVEKGSSILKVCCCRVCVFKVLVSRVYLPQPVGRISESLAHRNVQADSNPSSLSAPLTDGPGGGAYSSCTDCTKRWSNE